MSTDDQKHSAQLHGEALLAAQDDVFRLLLHRLAAPDVTPDERARIADELAGGAFAQLGPGADHREIGRRLIAAGWVDLRVEHRPRSGHTWATRGGQQRSAAVSSNRRFRPRWTFPDSLRLTSKLVVPTGAPNPAAEGAAGQLKSVDHIGAVGTHWEQRAGRIQG
jgi:hypothetical protein